MNRGFHKLIFSFIFLSVFSVSLFGQGRRAVSGILLDNEAVPLIQASVQLLSPKDSSLVEGVVTNGKGEYRLGLSREIIFSKVLISASFPVVKIFTFRFQPRN